MTLTHPTRRRLVTPRPKRAGRADFRRENPLLFPKLTEEQVAEVQRRALKRTYANGEALLSAGEADFCFHYVESGAIDIYLNEGCEPVAAFQHLPGEFTGDVEDLTGRVSNVTGLAHGETVVWEMCLDDLRAMINERIDIADVVMDAFIRRWLMLERKDAANVWVVGSGASQDVFRIREFLRRNRVLHNWIDLQEEGGVGREMLSYRSHPLDALPAVFFGHGEPGIVNPDNRTLAERMGIAKPLRHEEYDLAIVGAGPSGLAAAVYGASEGLRTIIIEKTAPSGQAGSSMRIENYLGFPEGLAGAELAGRATLQAAKFDVEIALAREVDDVTFDGENKVLCLDSGESLRAKTLLIATGAEYQKLRVPDLERYEGLGVYYAATPLEATMCSQKEVIVVGGGNSAGQAAVFLSSSVATVKILIRGDDLRKSMSEYLVHRIETTPNITVQPNSEITRLMGSPVLTSVEITNRKTEEISCLETPAVFTFIGAVPNVGWLPDEIERDTKGFVCTGASVVETSRFGDRRPEFLETSVPGVFAAGDVRSGSVKRVASSVGEGSMTVQFVHGVLARRG